VRDSFEQDFYPGKPKILFIGLPHSTHTASWIDLLADSELNVRLFGMPHGCPPVDWPVKTYITFLCNQANSATRKNLYRGIFGLIAYYLYKISGAKLTWQHWPVVVEKYKRIIHLLKFPLTPEAFLAKVIRQWQPDVIHTLGLFDLQGGIFYHDVRERYDLAGSGKWILQLRGGSDLTLRRHDPGYVEIIQRVLSECHQIISDNLINIEYAQALGIPAEKFAPIAPVPGTGGINVDLLASSDTKMPSERERVILWPKASELPWAKAIPILEAIRLAWPRISPCKIHILQITPEVRDWFRTLPEEIQQSCILHELIPRQQFLELLQQARLLLSPSLIDGIPNILYEAMACGSFPIISPLDTIRCVVEDEVNVLFARNLYPTEIADALVTAMNDDRLVDACAKANLKLVRKVANREWIRPQVISYYESLVRGN